MHMSDALITPVVGGVMIFSSIGISKYSLKNLKENINKQIPVMAIMGAFIFAFQMINFTIPGTGSSGHIGGGLLLSIILGPYAGFITLGVVLFIQAFFFADGGILALGCNLINMGFFTCFIAYPLVFKGSKRIILSSILAAVVGLQLGSLGVVFETLISGRTDLPLKEFLGLMQGIHLLIAIIEGVITGVIVKYLLINNPEVLYGNSKSSNKKNRKRLILGIGILTLLIASVVSLYASSNPDGLEWSIFSITGQENLTFLDVTLSKLSNFQERLALFPGYDFKNQIDGNLSGTSLSGIIGSISVFLVVFIIGLFIRKRKPVNE